MAVISFQNKRHCRGHIALLQQIFLLGETSKAGKQLFHILQWAISVQLWWVTSKDVRRGPIKPTLRMQSELIIPSTFAD